MSRRSPDRRGGSFRRTPPREGDERLGRPGRPPWLISRELTVTRTGLALRSLFLDRSIPVDRVEAAIIEDKYDEGRYVLKRTTVRGDDGQTIVIESSMAGYGVALGLLRSRTGRKWHRLPTDDPDFA